MKTVQLCGAICWYLNKRIIIIQINDDMKNTGKIAGILLMLFIAGSLSLSAQRGMRGMRPDSAEMNWMKMKQWQMPQLQA
jgi:hypothetical protein